MAAGLIVGGFAAACCLAAGIAVPLAGGTDFNGFPRTVGTALVVAVWLAAVVGVGRARRWGWLAALLVLSPLWPLWHAVRSDAYASPERWSAFASAPWSLVLLALAPLPLCVCGAVWTWRYRDL